MTKLLSIFSLLLIFTIASCQSGSKTEETTKKEPAQEKETTATNESIEVDFSDSLALKKKIAELDEKIEEIKSSKDRRKMVDRRTEVQNKIDVMVAGKERLELMKQRTEINQYILDLDNNSGVRKLYQDRGIYNRQLKVLRGRVTIGIPEKIKVIDRG